MIVEKDPIDETRGRVIYQDKLKDVEVMIDLSNPRVLVLASKTKVRVIFSPLRLEYAETNLVFENVQSIVETKNMIEEGRRLCKDSEL